MIKLLDILKEMISINSKGELVDNDDMPVTDEETTRLKKLGFDIGTLNDEDILWYWQKADGNMIGPSSEYPESILNLPIIGEIARKNYINSILRHDNLWMLPRPKEKTNYINQDLFDDVKYYFVNKEGKIIAIEDTLDELIKQSKLNPNKFINCMLKKY
jgi:hypothetical protein